MAGFREHVLDKYFAYRRRYVDYVSVEAPRRARMAVLSEIARLSFAGFGAFLCAFVFGLLILPAVDRHGYLAAAIFVALAGMSLWFGALTLRGLLEAWRDPRRHGTPGERERTR